MMLVFYYFGVALVMTSIRFSLVLVFLGPEIRLYNNNLIIHYSCSFFKENVMEMKALITKIIIVPSST